MISTPHQVVGTVNCGRKAKSPKGKAPAACRLGVPQTAAQLSSCSMMESYPQTRSHTRMLLYYIACMTGFQPVFLLGPDEIPAGVPTADSPVPISGG